MERVMPTLGRDRLGTQRWLPVRSLLGVAFVMAAILSAACGADLESEQKSCLAGNEGACYAAAMRHAEGEGSGADPARRFEWMARAADLGHPVAEVIVARAYEEGGLGVEVSIPDAYFWYRLAAAQGNGDGIEGVRRVALRLSKEEVAVLEDRLASWKPGLKDRS